MTLTTDGILSGLQRELTTFTQLAPGWDGYTGVPVSRELADASYAHAKDLLGLGLTPSKINATTGNGYTVTLMLRCGAYTILSDIDSLDLVLDELEPSVMVRSYARNGAPKYSVMSADSWDELIGKIKELG